MNSLLITTSVIIVDGKTKPLPKELVIILPNGHIYEMEEVMAEILHLDSKKKPKKKPYIFFPRSKRWVKAFKSAISELETDDRQAVYKEQKEPSI